MANYNSLSPYYKTPQSEFYLLHYVHRKVEPDSTDLQITLESRHEYRPDLISFELYGDTRLWWILVNRNLDKIIDPIYSFKSGITLFYPRKDRISKFLT